jgi:hypothetical protein
VSGSRLLDRPLAAARARIAGLGLVATEDQLYYELCRVLQPVRWRRKRPGFLVPPPVPRAAFAAALARAGGPDPVPATVAMADAAGPDVPDLLEYAIPRVLVCQHDRLAAVLLANDLHMESATAVLGPAARAEPPPALLAAMARAPQPVVHLLHDATPAGAAWAAGGAPGWHPVRVRALGLRPPQARALHLFRAPGGGAELAAVPPDHLLRALRRMLNGRTRTPSPPGLRDRAGLGFLSWPSEGR